MKHKGFTVIEILVAVSIITLVVTIVAFSFSKLNSRHTLDKSAVLIVAILDEARSLTLSSAGASQYGVHFEDSQVVLFKGSAYSSLDPLNVVTEPNTLVGLRNITLSGGGTDVVFKRLTGGTDQTGSVEVFLKTFPEIMHTISISATGVSNADF